MHTKEQAFPSPSRTLFQARPPLSSSSCLLREAAGCEEGQWHPWVSWRRKLLQACMFLPSILNQECPENWDFLIVSPEMIQFLHLSVCLLAWRTAGRWQHLPKPHQRCWLAHTPLYSPEVWLSLSKPLHFWIPKLTGPKTFRSRTVDLQESTGAVGQKHSSVETTSEKHKGGIFFKLLSSLKTRTQKWTLHEWGSEFNLQH